MRRHHTGRPSRPPPPSSSHSPRTISHQPRSRSSRVTISGSGNGLTLFRDSNERISLNGVPLRPVSAAANIAGVFVVSQRHIESRATPLHLTVACAADHDRRLRRGRGCRQRRECSFTFLGAPRSAVATSKRTPTQQRRRQHHRGACRGSRPLPSSATSIRHPHHASPHFPHLREIAEGELRSDFTPAGSVMPSDGTTPLIRLRHLLPSKSTRGEGARF